MRHVVLGFALFGALALTGFGVLWLAMYGINKEIAAENRAKFESPKERETLQLGLMFSSDQKRDELQKTVEAVLGPHLHKQNFRRMVEGGGLVEPTGAHRLRTGGRPARLYRFRCDVLWERAAPGVRVKAGRA